MMVTSALLSARACHSRQTPTRQAQGINVDSSSIAQLLRPAAFGHDSGEVTLRETHISWVILAGDFAYKIKKPVDFGFLDFSTLALRRQFCEQELLLNRRFAPELYLAVVAVTGSEQGPQIAGDGPVIDYAVQMRRFDEDQLLDTIAARGGLTDTLVHELARELARLQNTAPAEHPGLDSDDPGSPTALYKAIEQNFQQLRQYSLPAKDLELLEAVEQWSRLGHADLLPTLEQRLREGKVIDGHGDAHLGNIALVDGAVRLFDCIEFNPAFRVMDSIAEIAFLSMDLDARDFHQASHQLLTNYLEYRDDYPGLALLDLYRCYFAMVRAKVALLREAPEHEAITTTAAYTQCRRYLALAHSYSRPRQVFVAITHGVSGSGKSTVAAKLVAAGGAVRIRSDVERKRLFGLAPRQRSNPEDATRLYSTAMSRKTFSRLETLAASVVGAGFGVIVDATFLHRRVRDDFRTLAHKLGVPFVIIDCRAEPAQLRQRLIARERAKQDASEAGVAVMESQLQVDQPLTDQELNCRLSVHSSEDAQVLWQGLQDLLKRD
jgi:uncharacterized protein